MIPISNFSGTTAKFWNAPQIQDFLKQCRFTACKDGEDGISWLELYVLFRLCGGEDGIKQPERRSATHASMRAQVKTFKNGVKEVVKMTVDSEEQNHFKPNAEKKPRLRGLGIDTHMAMINIRVAITEEASSALASEILKSQKRRSESEIREIILKKMRFECTRYKDF